MSIPRIQVDRMAEGSQQIVAKARGQVIHTVNLATIEDGLRSRNHGRRRRAERQLLRAVKRGVIRRVGAEL